jgi:hypothetical protein
MAYTLLLMCSLYITTNVFSIHYYPGISLGGEASLDGLVSRLRRVRRTQGKLSLEVRIL